MSTAKWQNIAGSKKFFTWELLCAAIVSKVLIFLDNTKGPDTSTNVTFGCTEKEGFLCAKDNLCIYKDLVCDGQRNCPSGEDENIDECIKRNTFPPAATVKCNETDRPDDLWIEILAIPCNGKGTTHILRKHIFRPYESLPLPGKHISCTYRLDG